MVEEMVVVVMVLVGQQCDHRADTTASQSAERVPLHGSTDSLSVIDSS